MGTKRSRPAGNSLLDICFHLSKDNLASRAPESRFTTSLYFCVWLSDRVLLLRASGATLFSFIFPLFFMADLAFAGELVLSKLVQMLGPLLVPKLPPSPHGHEEEHQQHNRHQAQAKPDTERKNSGPTAFPLRDPQRVVRARLVACEP